MDFVVVRLNVSVGCDYDFFTTKGKFMKYDKGEG